MRLAVRGLLVFLAALLLCAPGAEGRQARLFATPAEVRQYRAEGQDALSHELFEAIRLRVNARNGCPGIDDASATTQWWHHVSEYLTDAALVHALAPTRQGDEWLRANVLDLVRRPVADWAGPPFRRYRGGVMTGGLETAHLSWSVALCLDMAGDLFTPAQTAEIRSALREKGLQPCRRYLESNRPYHNWNCVLYAGFTVAAAVLGDKEALDYAAAWFPVALDHFQEDGSYGETLQYAGYAAYALMLAHETLLRAGVALNGGPDPYARLVDWAAYAYVTRRPVFGWPIATEMPRSVNFGDCAAVFRPSGDFLLYVAGRGGQCLPRQAGIAAWLFDRTYRPVGAPAVHDMASFGFINDFGFLSVLLAPLAAAPLSPSEAGYAPVRAFSSGDAFARDAWDGKTVLALRMPPELLHATGHLHHDFNSLQLYYNGERMLADAGHSCYRNLTRTLDVATSSHNSCTFETADGRRLEQEGVGRRYRRELGPKWEPEGLYRFGGERLMCERKGEVSVLASDAAELYGAPLRAFRRTAVLCGASVVFVVDQIRAGEPLTVRWNWLLDNRDGALSYQYDQPGLIRAVRPGAAMKMQRFGTPGRLTGPTWALMHDAYHSLPGQFCEGRPGSGISFALIETEAAAESRSVHIIALDTPGDIDAWTLRGGDGIFTAEKGALRWTLECLPDGALRVIGPDQSFEFRK